MRDYGKVYTAFWSSEDTRSLSEDARTLALYLLTCQHSNMLGCFRLTNGYAADDLQWESERVSKGFNELTLKGFAYRCDRTFWVFVRQFLKWNQFENPNVGKAAGKMFDTLSCPMQVKSLLAAALREYSPHFPAAKLNAFESKSEPFENPFELSPETRTRTRASTTALTTTGTRANTNVGQSQPDESVIGIFEYWQKTMNSPKSVLDANRKKAITKALKDYTARDICKAIRGCGKSAFHMGKNDGGTKYNQLTLILRSADHIEKFMALDDARHTPGVESDAERQARIIAEACGDSSDDGDVIEMEVCDAAD